MHLVANSIESDFIRSVAASPAADDRGPAVRFGHCGWGQISAPEAEVWWNDLLCTFADASPFQAFEMGSFYAAQGWMPVYFVHNGDGSQRGVKALSLCLVRRYSSRAAFVWCVGGPTGAVADWEGLPQALRRALGLKHVYFRARCDRRRLVDDVLALRNKGWSPSTGTLGANLTMMLDLSRGPDALLKQMSKGWQRNLRYAQKKNLWAGRDYFASTDALNDVFAQMVHHKGIDISFPGQELGALMADHPERCALYTVRDGDGAILAFGCILTAGHVACYYYAAATEAGRAAYASYLLLWTAFCDLHQRGVTLTDLGGIDPLSNPGGYYFKQSTGAEPVESLGEWDWATSRMLKWQANKAIKTRAFVRKCRSRIHRMLSDHAPR